MNAEQRNARMQEIARLLGCARAYADRLSDPAALAIENLADAIEELALALAISNDTATEKKDSTEHTDG